jgi:uncharacterized repeat protein (TIGR03803 family)
VILDVHVFAAEQNHWSERGRALPVGNADALGRPRRSVLSFGTEVSQRMDWVLKVVSAAAAAAAALAMQASTVLAQPSAISSTNSYDGANPRAALVLSGNTLYGTSSEHAGAWGGACGTVFKVNTDGKDFAVLHFFPPLIYPYPTNSDGAGPMAGLVLSGHTLYGSASGGGTGGAGTVFKVDTDGTGFAVLHNFTGQQFPNRPINYDGARPMARLALSGHTLYGTAQRGGGNEGTLFKMNTDGIGFTTLHTFAPLRGRDLTNGDGAFPEAELLVSGNTLYGTAWSGGPGRGGTVFKLSTDGMGFTVLHSFTVLNGSSNWNGHGSPCNAEGAYPEAGLVLLGATLYGTAHAGGPAGNGTVFKLNTDGTGFAVLHSFTAHGNSYPDNLNNDGESPQGLLLSGNTLYGVASQNGKGAWGTLFRVNADGTGFEVLHSFDGSDGSSPQKSLLLSGDTLYGTANFGGGQGGGAVFKLNTDGTGFTVLHRFTKEPLPPSLTD